MNRRTVMSIIVVLLLLFISSPLSYPARAQMDANSETEALVQKGLTIAEIDRELERLNKEDTVLAEQIAQSEIKLAAQQRLAQVKRDHAGHVLRSYYMGERDSLWLLLFSLHSFQDLLKTVEYMGMILAGDQRKLSDYRAAMQDLKQLQSGLISARTKLKETQAVYLAQRDRLIRLQDEFNRQLAANPDAEEVMKLLQTTTALWKQRGLPMFRNYFSSLASAMQDLPQLGSKSSSGKPLLTFENNNVTFTLSDTDLNDFLRARDRMFHDITFQFVKDGVTAEGKKDDITMYIQGAYEIDSSKKIVFRVRKLTFNGYELPDTTVRDLEREIDLSLNPKALLLPVEPTELLQEEHKLTIRMRPSF